MHAPLSAVDPGIIRPVPLQALQRAAQFPATFVLAPAGAGKSVLLQQWAATLPCAPVVLQVQHRDNELGAFMRRIFHEIRSYCRAFDIAWFNPLQLQADNMVIMAEHFAQALQVLPADTYILIDDFHLLDDGRILQLFTELLLISPPHVHFVLLSRQAECLPVTRLNLQNRLLLIESQTLNCTLEDIQALNTSMGAVALSQDDYAFIHAMTEGWIIGVKLALLACQRYGRNALNNFHGHAPEMIDYFGPVVFQALPASVQQFYLCSAVLDKFDAPLCDYVLQRDDSAAMLEKIRSRELFVLPVAGQAGWFRYHGLLKRFLLEQFARQDNSALRVIQRRAAEYFAERQQYDVALAYASESECPALFAQLLQAACITWRREGQYSEILKWLEPLSEHELTGCADYLRAMTVALIQLRYFSRARYFLNLWDKHAGNFTHGAEIGLLLRNNLNMFAEDMAYVPCAGLHALAQRIDLPGLAGLSQLLLAYHNLMHGQLSEALRLARQCKELLLQSRHVYVASYADLISAMCNRYSARVLDARNAVYEDFASTDKDSPAWINRATAMLVVFYEENNQQSALDLCEEIFSKISASSATEAIFIVHLIMSRILLRRAEPVRALRLLQQLEIILRAGNYPRFIAQLEHEYIRQAYVQGQFERVEELAGRFMLAEISQGDNHNESQWRRSLAWVYVLLARRQHQQAQRVLRSLAHHLRGSEWSMRCFKVDAALSVMCDNDNEALQALLTLAQTYGLANFCCTVFDEVPGLLALLQRLHQGGVLPIPAKYLRHYQDLFTSPAAHTAAPANNEALTLKEKEILQYLCAGLSNTAISEKTGVAISTTKWHLKNIYAKLGVNNRTQAILHYKSRQIPA